jgi:peptide/nickel transport system permease protein
MLRFIAQRLLVTVFVIAVTSMVAFSLVHLSGDPAVAMAGENASPADVEAIRKGYGLDRSIAEQYLTWVRRFVAGDFGRSHYLKLGVGEVLPEHLAVTATLGILALAFALALSVPLGVLAALRPNTIIDRVALSIAVAGQALPSFLFALGLIYLFGVVLRWLPVSGDATWWHFILPAVALGYYATPAIMRLTRSGMMEVLQSDHVRTARAFGLSPWSVVVRHGLRHAIIPVVSLAAVQLGFMLGGSIVTYALLTLLADILNAALDPRIRVG